jgi:hypothetical protein
MCHSNDNLKVLHGDVVSVSSYAPDLRERFCAPGVDLACVRYEGAFGADEVCQVELLTAKGKYVDFEMPPDAHEEFRALCKALLETRFPCWWAEEGAEGRFEWFLRDDRLTHVHRLRVARKATEEGTAPLAEDFGGLDGADIPF